MFKPKNQPEDGKTYNATWASNTDLDQPAQLYRLIRGFLIHHMKFIIFA